MVKRVENCIKSGSSIKVYTLLHALFNVICD